MEDLKWRLTPVNLTLCSETYSVPCKFQKKQFSQSLHDPTTLVLILYMQTDFWESVSESHKTVNMHSSQSSTGNFICEYLDLEMSSV